MSKKHIKKLADNFDNLNDESKNVAIELYKKKPIADETSFSIHEGGGMFYINFNNTKKNFRYGRASRDDVLKKANEFRDALLNKYNLENRV